MQVLLGIALFASSALAQAWTCGAHGTKSPSAPASGVASQYNTAYDCGRICAVTTTCRTWIVGGPEGCQLVYAAAADIFVANASSPYQFYEKYTCDYTTLRASPSLAVASPTPSGGVCGVKAYDKQAPGSFYSYVESSYQTLPGCYLQCQDRGSANCQAFAIGGGYCLLYSVKLANDVNPSDASPYTYYDMDCLTTVTGSPSATPTTVQSSTSVPVIVSSSSVVAAAQSSTPAAVCNINGVAGYDKQTPAAYTTSSTATTLASCSALCKGDSKCNGFAVGGGLCLLYASGLANNVAAAPSSPYIFYDLACVAAASSAASSAAASAAATSSGNAAPSAAATSAATLQTSISTSSTAAAAQASATAKTCAFTGFETTNADASIVGFKFKPTAGCKSFCAGKAALSYEQYYDYCICFNKTVTSVATSNTTSTVVFNDITC